MTQTMRVWTGASGTTPVFVPLFTMPVNQVGKARLSYVIFSRTSTDIEVRRRVRYSDDGFTWGSATTFESDSWVVSTDWQWGGDYYTPNDAKQYVQYGLEVMNVSTSTPAVERGNVTVVLDLKAE